MAVVIMAACATTVQQEIANEPPTSVEALAYFPFQVKGYQNSYPRRRMLVLMPTDARDFKDAAGQSHEPDNGNPATGVMLGPDGSVVQRVYSSPLGAIVQDAIVRAADEAGMVATSSNEALEVALKETNEDYILASKITRCWVNKHTGADSSQPSAGQAWFTTAEVALDVTIYKPPFDVAFWQALGPTRIFEAAWDLVVTAASARGIHEDQLRLQRSVEKFERRGRALPDRRRLDRSVAGERA